MTSLSRSGRRAAGAVLAAVGALAALSACAPAGSRSDDRVQIRATAEEYMRAWLDKPSDPRAMCRLQAPQMRPNYPADGGTRSGCIARYRQWFADQDSDASRGRLAIGVARVQPIRATATRPAGRGVLVALQRTGEQPYRYALRLVDDGGRWRIAQSEPVNNSLYRHAEDPVGVVLERAE